MAAALRKLPFAVFVVVVLAGLFYVWLERAKEEDRAASARTAVATSTRPADKEGGENDIRVDAWVDDSRVTKGTTVAFWISVQNTSTSQTITDVAIKTFRLQTFEIPTDSKCWRANIPVCGDPAPRALKPQEAMTIEGDLHAGDVPGSYAPSAVIGWIDGSKSPRRTPISLGPVTVENEAKKSYATRMKALQNYFKDLGIALMLLYLGYVVKNVEEAREEKRRRSDERNTRVRETWNSMLSKIHANAEKHYMPLMGWANQTAKYYEGSDEDPEVCFFFYLSYLAGMKQMTDAIGGFYLSSRDGEDVAAALWDLIRDRADIRFERPARERAQRIFAKYETFDDYLRDLPRRPTIRRMLDDFLDEYDRFAAEAVLFELFETVLTFETNWTYAFWYRELEKFPVDDFNDLLKKLSQRSHLLPGEKYEKLEKKLKKYAEAIPGRQSVLEDELQEKQKH